jgi:site-specific recombinase XerD
MWYIDYYDASGTRRRVAISRNKKIALEALREAERKRDRIRAGLEAICPSDVTVDEVFGPFVEFLRGEGLAPGTVRIYERKIPQFVAHIGAKRIADITLEEADRYKAERRAQGISGRTVNITLGAVRRMLDWAVERNKLAINPLARLSPAKDPPRIERRALSRDEVRRLLEASPDPLHDMWALYLATGMRRNELVFLKWRDVDLANRTIRLLASRTKTRRSRLVYFGPRMAAVLKRRRAEPADYCFTTRIGTPFRNGVLKRFRACCRRAGIDQKGVDIQALRVTFATLVMETGADLKTAQTLIGHGSVSGVLLLDRYAKPQVARLRRVVSRVENIVLGRK